MKPTSQMSHADGPDVAGSVPPHIEPVPDGVRRPLWSVMIPTYNCAGHLGETLRSVLAQDAGEGFMQIEVVDDCSTRDDPERVVREVGRGRVTFFRKPKNGGVTANFNTCLRRSTGRLVHLLHGDDYVLPGFYKCLEGLASVREELALFACRTNLMDEAGNMIHPSDRSPVLEQGSRDASLFFHETPILTPSIVVRRAFYEKHGGFLPSLVHTADWEMWARAVDLAGGIVSHEVLACYRMHAGNDTSRLTREAENLRDSARCNAILAKRFPAFDRDRADRDLCTRARAQAERFFKEGDFKAARANRDYWRANAPAGMRARRFLEGLQKRVSGFRKSGAAQEG